MEGEGVDASLAEPLGQLIGPLAGAAEDQRRRPALHLEQVLHQCQLAIAVHRIDPLLHLRRRGVAGCHFDKLGVAQQHTAQGKQVVIAGGGEQQGLAIGGDLL
ncbi:hypothetical protein D3C79_528210 [compost metagenome]